METLLQLKGSTKRSLASSALRAALNVYAGRVMALVGKWRRQVHYDEGVDRDLHP